MFSPEATARLEAIRAKVLAGTASKDDLLEGIGIIRQDRARAQVASTKSRSEKAAAAAPVDTGKILADLKALGAKLQSGPVA